MANQDQDRTGGEAAFTAVFPIDITKFDGNPFHADTPFGRCKASGIGDEFKVSDELRVGIAKLEAENARLRRALRPLADDLLISKGDRINARAALKTERDGE